MRETTEHTLEFERNLSDNQKAFLITPLNKLPISARARHAFPEAGIHIVGDLIEKPISGLSALPKCRKENRQRAEFDSE